MAVDYFPACLTGHFTDQEGTEELRFLPDYDAYFVYSIKFRGKLLQFVDLDDLMPLLPYPGDLRIAVPVHFRHAGGDVVPTEILVTIRYEPDETGKHKGTALEHGQSFQCSVDVAGRTCQTRPFSDRTGLANESGLEGALLKLGEQVRPMGHILLCFFCMHSDYEPSTSIGHLYCFAADKKAYAGYASSSSSRDRKYRIWNLSSTPVDEFHWCGEFEPRPEDWGYRG